MDDIKPITVGEARTGPMAARIIEWALSNTDGLPGPHGGRPACFRAEAWPVGRDGRKTYVSEAAEFRAEVTITAPDQDELRHRVNLAARALEAEDGRLCGEFPMPRSGDSICRVILYADFPRLA